jgi:hypothetical protein
VSQEKLAAGGVSAEDTAFYKGKLANLRFYTRNLLPKATALGKAIQNGDESCLEDGLFD